MVIKNNTHLTGTEVQDLLVSIHKKTYIGRFLLTITIFLMGLFMTIIVLNTEQKIDSLVVGIIFLVISIILIISNIISYFRIPKTVYKSNMELIDNGLDNNFIFKEESFIVVSKSKSDSLKLEKKYTELSKIVEEETRILFYPSNTAVYICKKNCFQTSKELDLFFYGLNKHKIKIKKKIRDAKK